ncbi:MAG: glycosyltransferase [Candidatus Omnitrophica bacterium]|nr:glycosyltransferase [Candidatus Omnitrophota bacterium]
MSKNIVSVIIPSYNRKEMLSACLASVLRQDYSDTEVVVIDDGSSDGTIASFKERFPRVRFIRNEKSLGPACAKNQGLLDSRGEYVLFLDSDSELIFGDAISRMVAIMEERSSAGLIGGVALLDENGVPVNAFGKGVTFDGRSFPLALRRKSLQPLSEDLKECDYVDTCNCFVRKEVAFSAGGFDPYYVYMGEDKEFGMKVKRLGFKNFFCLKTAGLHKYAQSPGSDRRFMYLKARVRYALKNKGVHYLLFLPWLDIFFFCFFYPLEYLFRRARRRQGEISDNRNNPNHTLPHFRWLLSSPYYFLKAYLANLKEIPLILRARKEDFLSRESIENYKKYVYAKGKNRRS